MEDSLPSVASQAPEVSDNRVQEAAMEEDNEGPATSEDDRGEEQEENDEKLFSRAQKLMGKITGSQENPNPNLLHALSSMMESEESRYLEETGHSSNNGRTTHSVGRLGSLIRENDDFFDLIYSKFLIESRYSVSVQAATARLLFDCSITWMYPHVFDDTVLENIRNWAVEDASLFREYHNLKSDSAFSNAVHTEMLRTYSTGLLAMSLAGGSPVVEDVLSSGLPAKLMRYLRLSVLGDTSTSHRDVTSQREGKISLGILSAKSKEDGRCRARTSVDATHFDDSRMNLEVSVCDQNHEKDSGKNTDSRGMGEGRTDGGCGGLIDFDTHVADYDLENGWHNRDVFDGRTRFVDTDENSREDTRRRVGRIAAKLKGKVRFSEAVVENDHCLTSSGSVSRITQGRNTKERPLKNSDSRSLVDLRQIPGKDGLYGTPAIDRDDSDECFNECKIGNSNISELVKKAVKAAEDEARAVNAHVEAIKAAGDAAAEVVKSAAFDEYQSSNDEAAALLAASRALSTVIDAAIVLEASRISNNALAESAKDSMDQSSSEEEEFTIPDIVSLAKTREKFCIQCLQSLGEYVEVLGPVLHEKGVDVCLGLLQRRIKSEESPNDPAVLPDVMKLICALAAHKKFAALFVDRGGVEKLVAVTRDDNTFFGLSSCLFTIGSLQGIMERVCTLPSDLVHQVIDLALQLLECPQDQARKNAAMFFTAAFVFQTVVDSFDVHDGLKKFLSLLHDAASLRSNSGTLRTDRSSSEVLTSSEKQIAYHTCVALRQYFRAHLLLLVDSIRPNKSSRSAYRNIPSVRAAYKPLDLSQESIDSLFQQLQMDRKLGSAFVRGRWPSVEKFLGCNGHITMLELCQAPPVDRYLHDLLQYALGVLHIVTLTPYGRKSIVSAVLSNDRVGVAVILEAANCANYVDSEIIQPALNVLVNLVCPPPSISNKSSPQNPLSASGGQPANIHTESRDKISDRVMPSQGEQRERNGESSMTDRSCLGMPGQHMIYNSQTPVTSGLVGDRRISLGAGAGFAGLAAQLEQGYRQARDAVRTNNGIKVILHLLQPRIVSPPAALDCLRAIACRVLLGLARDEAIAQILTKLQVGKKLSELIRDSGGQTPTNGQGRWQYELAQVAIELIGIVTNSGRACTLVASDAATPTLRRIERAAIAAATPITYHSRELLLLIHEHLQASGLATTATSLLKEAQLNPLPSLTTPISLTNQITPPDIPQTHHPWPSGRVPSGFLSKKPKVNTCDTDPTSVKYDPSLSSKKKHPVFSQTLGFSCRNHPLSHDMHLNPTGDPLNPSPSKTPIVLPMKRKLMESSDTYTASLGKRAASGEHLFFSPLGSGSSRRSTQPGSTLMDVLEDSNQYGFSRSWQPKSQTTLANDPAAGTAERLTLDSIIVQYLKHQHRQCSAPIATLPPLSLLHPHLCPEPRHSLDAPSNVTARLGMHEFKNTYGGVNGNRRYRQFVYSRFRPWRTCRDDGTLLTCLTFLGISSHIVAGCHSGELKIFDSETNSVLESFVGHQSPLTQVQSSRLLNDTQLVLSSSSHDVRLWDASSISSGPLHLFEGCKSARFSNSGTTFAALPLEQPQREIFLYDVQTFNLDLKLSDTLSGSSGIGKSHVSSSIHFSPADTMVLWNGVLWDRRASTPVQRFDQFTDYGGGGFHPSGNEVIINSEVWDLRKYRLLRSVPSLDQSVVRFNARGDVIYTMLRRNLEDITSAVNTRRVKHPLFSAFRTIDSVNYSDIATHTVDRCVLDLATEPTDSFLGMVTMDDQEEMYSSVRVYEVGRRKPTDDDSDPDDADSEEPDDDDDEDEDDATDSILHAEFDAEIDSDADEDMSNGRGSSSDEDDEDEGDAGDGVFFRLEGGARMVPVVARSEEEEGDSVVESFSSGDEGYGYGVE